MPDTGWDVQPPNIVDFLESTRQGSFRAADLEAKTTFSILRNSRRGGIEIAELVAAIGADSSTAPSMATMPFERYVLFETIAALETEVRMQEDDLRPIVQEVYRYHMKPTVAGEKSLKQMEADIQQAEKWEMLHIMDEVRSASKNLDEKQNLSEPAVKALHIYHQIRDRLLSGEYEPAGSISYDNGNEVADADTEITLVNAGEIAQALTEKIVFDRCYVHHAQEAATAYVNRRLDGVLDAGLVNYSGTETPLQRLSVQNGKDRHTFMLTGAPACGKGSIIAAMEVQAKRQFNVDWEDTVKINTDNHRDIVSNARGLGDDATVHSSLNNYEASYITLRAYARVQEQADRRQGHHLLIDCVYPTEDRLQMGTQNDGQLHVACVSVPVDVSIERAFKRGAEIGRYVGPGYLVGSHKLVSRDLLANTVRVCENTRTELDIFNTDVPRGDQPIQVMKLDMQSKTAIIYDADSMAMIYGKKNINERARNCDELYESDQDKLDYSYVTELQSLGITVEFASQEMEDRVNDHLSAEEKAWLEH